MKTTINFNTFSNLGENFKVQELQKAYQEGVYSDSLANRKLGRVGMTYKQYDELKNKDKNSPDNKLLKKPKSLLDLRNDPRVDSIYSEYSESNYEAKSWWCNLKGNYQDSTNPGSHTLHCNTIKEICDLVDRAIKI